MILLALLAAAGVALFVSGLPLWEGSRLERRVSPYLPGGAGRPSAPAWRRILRSSDRKAAAAARTGAADLRFEKIVSGSLGVGIALAFVVVSAGSGSRVDGGSAVLLAAVMFALGYSLRGRMAVAATARKTRDLVGSLPVALDLLTIAVLSGESIPEAFGRVGRAVGGVLGEEFDSVLDSIRSGRDTVEALEGLADRIPDLRVARLVDALSTAFTRGAPIAEVLRGQAEDQRAARRAYLLELGGRREILMLVPVVFLILPVVVVFALFPGLVTLDLLVP